jgi:hypothetical protein
MLAGRNVGSLQQNFDTMHRCGHYRNKDTAAKTTGIIPCIGFQVRLYKVKKD